jgi:hypothetical protein
MSLATSLRLSQKLGTSVVKSLKGLFGRKRIHG